MSRASVGAQLDQKMGQAVVGILGKDYSGRLEDAPAVAAKALGTYMAWQDTQKPMD